MRVRAEGEGEGEGEGERLCLRVRLSSHRAPLLTSEGEERTLLDLGGVLVDCASVPSVPRSRLTCCGSALPAASPAVLLLFLRLGEGGDLLASPCASAFWRDPPSRSGAIRLHITERLTRDLIATPGPVEIPLFR